MQKAISAIVTEQIGAPEACKTFKFREQPLKEDLSILNLSTNNNLKKIHKFNPANKSAVH